MGLVSSVETGEELKKRKDAERKESLLGKPLHGKYFATVEKLAEEGFVDLDRSWQWLKGGFLTKASEGFIMAAQEQALQTRWRKSTIEGSEEVDGLCRICGEWFETVKHIVSGCSELAKKQYRIRHDKVGSRIHWVFAENMALIVQLSGMTMFLAESANPRMVYMRYSGTLSFSLVMVLSSTSLIWLLLIMQIRSGPLLISVSHGMEM